MYAVQTMLNIFLNMLPDMRVVEWIRTLEPPKFRQDILHGDNRENLLKNQFSYCRDEKQTGFQMKTLSFQQY